MNEDATFGEKISIKNQEEFDRFMRYWQAQARAEKNRNKKNIQKVYIVCGNEDFKCESKNGECRL